MYPRPAVADDAHDLVSTEKSRVAPPADDGQSRANTPAVSSALARRTLWNRMWGRPIVRDGLTPRRLRELNGIRAFGLGLALAVDGILYVGLRAEPLVRNTALVAFLAVNVPLLVVDLALVLGMRRANRAPALVLGLSVAIEMFTTIVWTQATGSVSSYFLLLPPFLIFLYRFMIGYGPGLVCLATAMGFHAGAVVLERAGILVPGALFVAPPGPMYESAGFHLGALVSIQSIFMVAFACSNYLSRALREKDEALREAHDDLE